MKNKIITFKISFFLQQCIYYIYYYIKKKDVKNLNNIIFYIVLFLQSHIIKIISKPILIINNRRKTLILLNNKHNKITNMFYYVYYLIKYYSLPQHYNQLFNLNYLNCLITNIFFFLYKYNIMDINIIDENWLKWISIGAWTIFTSLFIRKKYKEYKYTFNYSNKYKYKTNWYNNFGTFWKVYYKYGGNYQQYLYLKNFFLLNKNINKKKLLIYDFKLNKFIVKLNNYYNLLLNELPVENSKNKQDYVYNLFNVFLKPKLDTPFRDSNISFTYYYFKKDINKKELEKLSYLVSYDYLYKKIKKSVISDLTVNELYLNYKNFYKSTINNNFEKDIMDIFNVDLNEPLITPARIYKKFQKWIDFETLFNNIDNFDIETLYNYIIEAFDFIKQTDMMLSINIDEISNNDNINTFEDVKNAFNNNELNFFDYKIIKNDFNLIVQLNSEALNNESFNNFIRDLKNLLNYSTSNVLNINIFEDNFLQDKDMLTLFLKEKFFYLDYFTLAINSQKYSLCYLLFLFKVLQNKKNYEIYYNNYCNNKINKYNKIVYKYHKHVSIKLQNITNVFNSYIKYRTNKILINVNNFDNINFIKNIKKKKFYKIYNSNYKHKINYKNDYKEFLYYFEKYKSIKNFEKKELNITDVITFDEFLYNDINIFDLQNKIKQKQKQIEEYMQHYIYENNKLLNYLNLGFYLYDINGFENCKQDVFLFYEYKEHEYLKFYINDIEIYDKIEFQNNYSILYFHYLIKLFKNFKHYIFNIAIENIIFDDNFLYLNYDNSMNEKRIDFLFHLECFIKSFKTIITAKQTYMTNFINYLILNYGNFLKYNEVFDYNLLYNSYILKNCNKKDLFNLENNLDNIMQIWKHILEKLEESREFYVNSINVLKLNKLIEFFDFPMFNKVKGFLLLKEAYYTCLEELIIEERAFDHAFNISMCLFRTFDKHNTFFKQDILFNNGFMPRLCSLSVEDWDYVFELEKKNPLILIQLYNSKQLYSKSECWNNLVSFMDVVYKLSNINEKDEAYNTLDDDWNIFLNKMRQRDLIIYDFKPQDIENLNNIFILYNNTWFNKLNIEDELVIFFEKNFLKYDFDSKSFKKMQNKNNEIEVELEVEEKQQKLKKGNKNKKKSGFNAIKLDLYLKDKIIYINNEYDNIIIYNNFMDKTNDIVEISNNFFTFLESKIKLFQKSNFQSYLVNFFKELNEKYNDFTYLNYYIEFSESLNTLFYLIKFYDNITALNEFDFSSINLINNKIINNDFNYFDENEQFINLNYVKFMFKLLNKSEIKNDWSKALSKSFNNRFLFIYYSAQNYLLNIFNVLNKKETYIKINVEQDLNYLSNLNIFINKCNYNNNLIYNIYDSNFLNTFDALFNALNVHILKANYMLNQFNVFKQVIFDIYLNHYNFNKTNINILKDLYFLVYNNTNKNNNFKYLALMNLLLYVKDPIYLYNILLFDLKNYIQNILTILDIIHKPELHTETYNTFLEFLMYKHNTLADWTKPLNYKGWAFSLYNTNKPLIKQKNLDKINVNCFFSFSTIIELNNAISNLDQYNGYFNLDNFDIKNISQNCFNFDKELNLLELFNINKLLYNFDYLFTVNNVKGLYFYSLQEFMNYNELNNFESFNICSSYNMFLIHMLKQNYNLKIYFNNDSVILNQQNDKPLMVKDYEDLIALKKKIKMSKRKSAFAILNKKKKKTKIIKILSKIELDVEDDDAENSDEEQFKNDLYNADTFYKYVDLKVTDSDTDSDLDSEFSDNNSNDNESAKKNILEIKNDVVGNIHKNFIQWSSDLEFRKAYFNCKKTFNNILLDYKHPVWDEHRAYLKDEITFEKYVKRLSNQDREAIFNIFWDWTITEVLKTRENEYNKKIENNWLNKLQHVTQQTDPMENVRSNELLTIFCTNLERNEKWKKRWHHDMFFLDMYRGVPGKESHWRGDEYCKEKEGEYSLVNQENQLELWNKANWWKQW